MRPLALACLLAWQAPALATAWTGGTGDWFVTGNWDAGVPAAGVGAQLTNGGTVQVQAPGAVAQNVLVWFGSTLEVSGTGTLNTALFNLDNASMLNVTGGGQLTVSPNFIQLFRDARVLVDGAGSSFRGTNLNMGGNGGTTGVVATVSNGGTLGMSGQIDVGSSSITATLNVGSGAGAGILDTPTVTASGNPGVLNLNHTDTNYYLTRDGTSTGTGVTLSGNLSVTVNGGGTTTLKGAATYTGATTLTNGTLRAGANGAFSSSSAFSVNGSSTLDVNGTTQTIASLTGSSGATVALGSGSLTVGDASNTAYAGAITGSGGRLNKTGTGTLTLSGASSYSGATNVNQGMLATGGAGTLATGSAFTIASGATLDISGGTANQTVGSLAGAGSVTLGARSLTAGGDNSSTVYSGALSGNLGSTGLVKNGTGTLSITGDNLFYQSDTTINGGTLRVGNAQALGATTGAGTITLNNAKLVSDVSTAWFRDFTFASGTTGTVAAANGVTFGLRGVTINGDAVFGSGSDNGIVEIGDNSITNIGASLRVAAGTLRAQGGTSTLSTLTSTAGTTTIDSGALLDFSSATGSSGTIKNLQGAGILQSDGGTATVQAGSFSGKFTGSGNLAKSGAGTLTLSGANDYTGTTTVSAGTLQVGNGGITGQLGSGAVTIGSGATLGFNRTDTVVLANTISGGAGATLNQTGTGTLILTADSSYSGGVHIDTGSLQLGNGAGGGTSGSLGNGDITLSSVGKLVVNRSDALQMDNLISGAGRVIMDGSGTLTLTNSANSYDRGTFVNAGTLQVGTAGVLGSGSVIVRSALRGTDDVVLNNWINVTGTNPVISAAANKTFTLIGGTFQEGSDAVTFGSATDTGTVVFGFGVIGISGSPFNLHVAGGTLRVTGTSLFTTLSRSDQTTTVDAGATFDMGGHAATLNELHGAGTIKNDGAGTTLKNGDFSGRITGTTNLSMSGAGTFLLSGNNDYSGTTTVSSGTLQVGNGGTSGQLGSGAIANTATLAYNRSDTYTVANTLSGNGTLNKLGTGKMLYTGTGSGYTGTTNVNAGTLAVNGSLGGTLNVNSGATLNGTGTVGTLNVLNGGVLAPGNSIGTLTVTGNVTFGAGSIYRVETDAAGNADRVNATGSVIINGGTVDVQAGTGTYRRNTTYTILNGATGRTGAFTGVTSNLAFLTPTLAYDANNVFLTLASSNTISYTSVVGTPNQGNVAGALNNVLAGGGNALTSQIDSLSAQQARNAFDSMSGTQHAGASQAGGAMSRGFGDAVNGHMGGGADGTGGFGGVGALKGQSLALGMTGNSDMPLQLAGMNMSGVLGDASMNAASNAASGASYSRPGNNGAPGMNGAAAGTGSRDTGAAAGTGSRDTGAAAGDSGAAASGFGMGRANWGSNVAGQNGLWGQALGLGGRVASDGNGAGSSYRGGGFMVGYDRSLTANWLVGAAAGYTRATWDASVNGVAPANGKVTTPQGAVYARYSSGPWMVSFSGTYADHKFDTTRTITIGTASNLAISSHHGSEWGFSSQVEYALAAGAWQLRPLAGVRYTRLREDAFSENGNSLANLSVSERTTESTTVSAGMRLLRPFNSTSAADGGFELRAVYSHLFGDNDSPVSARLGGQAASFTSTGTPLKRDAMTLGAGVSAKLGKNFSGYLDASYEARGSGQDAYAVGAGVRYLW